MERESSQPNVYWHASKRALQFRWLKPGFTGLPPQRLSCLRSSSAINKWSSSIYIMIRKNNYWRNAQSGDGSQLHDRGVVCFPSRWRGGGGGRGDGRKRFFTANAKNFRRTCIDFSLQNICLSFEESRHLLRRQRPTATIFYIYFGTRW